MLSDLINELRPPMPEGKEHLVYKDFLQMDLHLWEWLLMVLEPYELEVLTYATYPHPTKDNAKLARGQIWVNPEGLTKLSEFFERDKDMLFPEEKVA